MNARIHTFALGAGLILAAACGRPGGESASAAGGVSTTTPLDRAVAVARAIQVTPAAADSILAAHGLTRDGFDSLMYDIAADSSLARAYTAAIK